MLRILHLNSFFYTSTVHKKLLEAFADIPITMTTYTPVPKGYFLDRAEGPSVLHSVVTSEFDNKLDRFAFHRKHMKILGDISRHIDISSYDCIHAHSLFSNGSIALKLKEIYDIPYIVAVRSTDINLFFKNMLHLRNLGKRILENASKIVFLSSAVRDFVIDTYIPSYLREALRTKSTIVPNGIDDFWLDNKGMPRTLATDMPLRLLYVGRVCKRKNLVSTVKAIELLQGRGFEVQYTVVGKIVDKAVFRRIQNKPFVNYHSPKGKEELIEVYRENDIFIMPSVTETFGLVYPEAMSQGLPIIYTKGQGFDGQFSEGTVGYHVRSNDPRDIADRTMDVVAQYEEISKNCIDCVDKFNWKDIAKVYYSQYCDVIKGSGKRYKG